MNLPGAKIKSEYLRQINLLAAELQTSVDEDSLDKHGIAIQRKLDLLAHKYQEDERLGKMRYKLYELQALIYYFQGKDKDALDFLSEAIKANGEMYPKAERLMNKLQPQQPQNVELVGLRGWLAWWLVGVGLTILFAIIQLAQYPGALSNLETIHDQLPGLFQILFGIVSFEIIGNIAIIILAICTLVQINRFRKNGKTLAIIFMVTLVTLSVIDFAMINSVSYTYSYDIDLSDAMSATSSALGRSVFYCLIWIPYFLISKRVKATLVK